MLTAFSEAIEARDPYARGHAGRVTALAVAVAHDLGWDERLVTELELGANLHDIGKLAVSTDVLCKPAPLTPEEREEVEVHPAVGARLVEAWPPAQSSLPYVLYHHERWDGRGYPRGLAAEEIPVGARLLAIADAYDAMISQRSYRAALAPEEAVAELIRCAGSQFDPQLVDAFVAVWGESRHAASA